MKQSWCRHGCSSGCQRFNKGLKGPHRSKSWSTVDQLCYFKSNLLTNSWSTFADFWPPALRLLINSWSTSSVRNSTCWSTVDQLVGPTSTLLLNCYLTIASQWNLLINSWSTKLSWSKLNNSYSTCWSAPNKQHVTQQLLNFISKIQLVVQQLHNMLHQPATGKLINSYSTLHPRTPSPRKTKLINSWSTLLLWEANVDQLLINCWSTLGLWKTPASGVLGFSFACGRRPHAKLNRRTERTVRWWPLQWVLEWWCDIRVCV